MTSVPKNPEQSKVPSVEDFKALKRAINGRMAVARTHARTRSRRHTLERNILQVLAGCYPEALPARAVLAVLEVTRTPTLPPVEGIELVHIKLALLYLALFDEVTPVGQASYRWNPPAHTVDPGAA